VFFLVALSIALLGVSAHSLAQDATPSAEAPVPGEGVSFTPIGAADGVIVPSPAMLLAVRVQMEAGATAPLVAGNASSGLFMVEAGEFTVQIDAAWSVTRSASAGGQIESPQADEVTLLKAGDVAYVPGDVAGELRNAGDLPALGVIFLVSPAMNDAAAVATPTN
jgi:uncharacterized cupin superfamily protein